MGEKAQEGAHFSPVYVEMKKRVYLMNYQLADIIFSMSAE